MGGGEQKTAGAPVGTSGFFEPDSISPAQSKGSSLGLERWLLAKALEQVGSPPLRFVLWDGREVSLPGITPEHDLLLRDRGALWRLVGYPEYQFPEMYARGRILLHGDLVRLTEAIQYARRLTDPNSLRIRLLSALFRPHAGSLAQARDNIRSHYDVGNDFYRLWLDERMLYTCAYFPDPDITLEQAQLAKMDHVCRKLRLQPGERVVEAGCGWGALAIHMAQHYGVQVRAFNISKSQVELARDRAKREGLAGRVEFVEGDYREIGGEYDAFVSIGMLEHVGLQQYSELGSIMQRVLAANGRGLIHTIGADRAGPLNAWIERRIFPGARPPSLGEMMPIFSPHGFSVLDVENLRLHYAKTLAHWLARFDAQRERVLEMFDPVFLRAWRFYLATSQTAFSSGHLQLYQVLFAHRGFNAIPWTRDYLYRD